ncbi:hypothetical protein C8Q80DRAFT_1113054, partial [Daedaleopsis nitida]
IGSITMDNAGNCDTMMVDLECVLTKKGINFDRDGNHICNLWEDAAYASALEGDPMKCAQQLVAGCQVSVARCLSQQSHLRNVQLLRGVDTRWSSTFLMIVRLLEQYPVCTLIYMYIHISVIMFMKQAKQDDIQELLLTDAKLTVLKDIHGFLKFPHSVQELLSGKQTPTVCVAIPAYEKLLEILKLAMKCYPKIVHAIRTTFDALTIYMNLGCCTCVYTLAMLLNPAFKCSWIEKHWTPEQLKEAEEWLFKGVSPILLIC